MSSPPKVIAQNQQSRNSANFRFTLRISVVTENRERDSNPRPIRRKCFFVTNEMPIALELSSIGLEVTWLIWGGQNYVQGSYQLQERSY